MAFRYPSADKKTSTNTLSSILEITNRSNRLRNCSRASKLSSCTFFNSKNKSSNFRFADFEPIENVGAKLDSAARFLSKIDCLSDRSRARATALSSCNPCSIAINRAESLLLTLVSSALMRVIRSALPLRASATPALKARTSLSISFDPFKCLARPSMTASSSTVRSTTSRTLQVTLSVCDQRSRSHAYLRA